MDDASPARGWYPDPEQSDRFRWWDGERWTRGVRRMFGPVTQGSTFEAGAHAPPDSQDAIPFEDEVGSEFAQPAPSISRAGLVSSANTWQAVGVTLLVLAAIGSVIAGIALAPTRSGFAASETDLGAAIGIGIAVFAGSVVAILPYFMLARIMRGVAQLLPATRREPPPTTPHPRNPPPHEPPPGVSA